MKPAEFEPIAVWNEWYKEDQGEHGVWWVSAPGVWEKPANQTSLTDAEAVEALNRLVEKGYYYQIWSGRDMKLNRAMTGIDIGSADIRDYEYEDFTDDPNCFHGFEPTIHEAIEQALLALIAAKGGKE